MPQPESALHLTLAQEPAGLEVSDEAFARDAYEEVGPGGHFLGSAHTMRNYQNAFYEPRLSDSENVESWEEGGALDMRARAHQRWKKMLKEYEAPPIERVPRHPKTRRFSSSIR